MRKKLKDVCDFYSGTGFPTKYQGETEGEYPFYKVGDIANNATAGKIYLELCNNYISSDVAKKIKGCILPKDTVVFAKIGEALKLNRRAITSCDCLIDNNAMGIAPRLDLLRIQYFYFFMKRLKMQTLAESTTVPSVRKAVLEAYEIEVPSLAEQEEIEKKLALMQKIIKKRRQELSALDELVNARFVEMFGSISDGRFEMKTLPEIVNDDKKSIKRGPFGGALKKEDFVEDGYLVYEQRHAIHNDFNYAKYYITKEKYESMIGFKVVPGDLIISCSGTLGRIAEVPKSAKEGIINQALLKISLNQDIMLNTFFIQQFRGEEIQEILFGFSRGSGIPNMPSMSEVKAVKFICPPIELQNQFADFVYQIDKSKVAVQKALDEAQLLFDSLMQEYFG